MLSIVGRYSPNEVGEANIIVHKKDCDTALFVDDCFKKKVVVSTVLTFVLVPRSRRFMMTVC